MRFEPATLCDLVGCSNHWATGDSMASKDEMWVFDWNRITRSYSQMMSWRVWTHYLHHAATLSLIFSELMFLPWKFLLRKFLCNLLVILTLEVGWLHLWYALKLMWLCHMCHDIIWLRDGMNCRLLLLNYL